jgi:hypothetical protein
LRRLLTEAEPYGDCLTFGPGHYDIRENWRRDRTIEPALRAVTERFEYEWRRGRRLQIASRWRPGHR